MMMMIDDVLKKKKNHITDKLLLEQLFLAEIENNQMRVALFLLLDPLRVIDEGLGAFCGSQSVA